MKWEGEEGVSHWLGQLLSRILNLADSSMPATKSLPNVGIKREEISGESNQSCNVSTSTPGITHIPDAKGST